MSPLPYIPPGVTISEVVSPSFSPVTVDPTAICVVGPAQGFQPHREVFVLSDNHPVRLAAAYPDLSTLVVRDASDATLAPFLPSTTLIDRDYVIDDSLLATSGYVRISRAMQTAITDGETVVEYHENAVSATQSDAFTQFLLFNGTTAVAPAHLATLTQPTTISVQSAGLAPSGDYVVAGAGGATPTIVWVNTATVLRKFQTIYIDYTIGGVTTEDAPVQLNNLASVSLPANADDIVVKNAPGADVALTAATYTKGTTTDADYIVSGSGTSTVMGRSSGSTSIGVAKDKLAVRVSYNATPPSYWLPTLCYSQGDVEHKYGAAFDAAGNISNPVSFAAGLAFQNGASSITVQALFTEGIDGEPRTASDGALIDWEASFKSLRDVQGINVIVPLIGTGSISTTDGLNLEILLALQTHLHYMQANQHHLRIMVAGEDSSSGTLATIDTLRVHAESLGDGNPAESCVLISPGAFVIANPITGRPTTVGGQYAAAAVAGMLARYTVQTPLTRKRVNVIAAVADARTESEKNADAAAGLLVVEAKRGLVQVRHGITTANDTIPHRELSVTRGKHFMMETLQEAMDTQVVGQMLIDSQAAFKIQLALETNLQQLIQQGVIVTYRDIQIRRSPTDPTGVQVRFSYLPPYPLNYVDILFSIDSSQGVLFSTTESVTTTQGL